MSGPDQFMPTYWGDYAKDTGHLNNAGHGAYLMLIKHYWCSGKPLPDDDAKLWRISCCDTMAGWKKLRAEIAPFFDIEGGQWRHGRIDRELAKAAERYERRSKAGQKGNNTRWGKDGNATEEATIETPKATDPASQCDPNAIPMRSQPQPQPHSTNVELTPGTPARRKRGDERKGSRIPPDWSLSPETRAWSLSVGASERLIEREEPSFRDYWIARDGPEAVKRDWDATWRNWIRKRIDDPRPSLFKATDRPSGAVVVGSFDTGTPYSRAWKEWRENGKEGPEPRREDFEPKRGVA